MISARPTSDEMTPARIESAPSDGPTTRSSRLVSEAGSAPDRSVSARSFALSAVKPPLMERRASVPTPTAAAAASPPVAATTPSPVIPAM